MTGEYTSNDTPPSVRVMCDGGTAQVTRTVTAKEVVTRDVDDEEREVLRVPISSTRQDREGDAFSKADLESRADQIRDQQPLVFDDHGMTGGLFGAGYSARETIGTQFDAELEEDDDGHHTLFAFVNPDHSHEEGTRMLSQVKDEKQAIKFSVGFRILETADDLREEDRPERANEVAGRLFTRTDLMETSRVGIPANPDASASVAAKNGAAAPGLAMHPMFARMMGIDPEQANAGVPTAAKTATDGGETPDDSDAVDALRSELDALRSEVAELREDDGDDDEDDDDEDEEDEEDDGKAACEVDTDCPEGEVCLEGECVPEDEVDDEEEDSADLSALRDEVAKLRKSVESGTADPETKDTSTTPDPELPDEGKDDDPDDDKRTDTDTEQRRPATDFARGN